MMFHFFRRKSSNPSIASLYGMIVAQARAAAFYRNYGVPDTVNGRFEMVVLHTVLVLRRLQSEPEAVRELGQGIFDRFCADMDGSLREMGVGDLAVPDKMRKIGEAFYGRQSAYVAALEAPDPEPLIEALARNVLGNPEPALTPFGLRPMCARWRTGSPTRTARPWAAGRSLFRTRRDCGSPARRPRQRAKTT